MVSSVNALPMPCVQVADSKGHTLFRKEAAIKGRFAFTTEDYDMFEVCFYTIITGQCQGGGTGGQGTW